MDLFSKTTDTTSELPMALTIIISENATANPMYTDDAISEINRQQNHKNAVSFNFFSNNSFFLVKQKHFPFLKKLERAMER